MGVILSEAKHDNEGVGRVDGVKGVKREYPLTTQNYSHYPAYSKFSG